VALEPVYLGAGDDAIGKPDHGYSLPLAPVSLAIESIEVLANPDARAGGNGLDALEVADDFELRTQAAWILRCDGGVERDVCTLPGARQTVTQAVIHPP
jgi:hypothetical protein